MRQIMKRLMTDCFDEGFAMLKSLSGVEVGEREKILCRIWLFECEGGWRWKDETGSSVFEVSRGKRETVSRMLTQNDAHLVICWIYQYTAATRRKRGMYTSC